jgi:hypothetical protein
MDQKERESTTQQAGSGPEIGAGALEGKAAAGEGAAELHRRPKTMQALLQERDSLFEEARRHPDSDAAPIVRVLLLDALADAQRQPNQEGLGFEGDEEPGSVKRQVREKKVRVEKPVKSVEDMDPQMVYDRIAEIVGLRSPAQLEFERRERERQRQGDEGDEKGSG